uniref:Uncharacterized protein n=1 Tax=Anguilla anguilla TaxID=7936 RepID=A0A0E9Q034_ANGAN
MAFKYNASIFFLQALENPFVLSISVFCYFTF